MLDVMDLYIFFLLFVCSLLKIGSHKRYQKKNMLSNICFVQNMPNKLFIVPFPNCSRNLLRRDVSCVYFICMASNIDECKGHCQEPKFCLKGAFAMQTLNKFMTRLYMWFINTSWITILCN
jgi:hypothetical protein